MQLNICINHNKPEQPKYKWIDCKPAYCKTGKTWGKKIKVEYISPYTGEVKESYFSKKRIRYDSGQ